jgi:hypothetical protein
MVLAAYTLKHRGLRKRNSSKQTAEYTTTGTKVPPRLDHEAEFVPEEVTCVIVPPVALSRPEPTRGSSDSFWFSVSAKWT